jgi:hypothetical protein
MKERIKIIKAIKPIYLLRGDKGVSSSIIRGWRSPSTRMMKAQRNQPIQNMTPIIRKTPSITRAKAFDFAGPIRA